jgi:hypothetical protein
MHRRAAPLLALLVFCAVASAQSPSPPSADRVKAALSRALELAKANRDADAEALLDKILKVQPALTSARFLRSKVRFRLKKFEDAETDAVAVLKEAPATTGITPLLEKIRENIKPVTVTLVGGASKYSEWQWSWTIDGTKSVKLEEYKGAEGYTLFYWPSRPEVKADFEKLERESSNDHLYFLRVIALKHPGGFADLKLPGATEHGLTTAPYMMWMDESGKIVAKGKPEEVQPKIDEFTKAKKEANAPVELLSKVDVSASTPAVEAAARSGYTTIVMVTSPACHSCQMVKDKVEAIPQNHQKVRVVMYDVGVTSTGGINWDSPFRTGNKVPSLPYYYIFDTAGKLSGSGDEDSGVIKTWIGE